jgi:xylulokinase
MAAHPLLIGLDMGSTHVKAVLFAPGRGTVHVARRETPTRHVPNGAFHDPAAMLGVAESAIAECASAAAGAGRPGPVAAIGVAGMAEAGVPLDGRGRPIGRIIAWFDGRPAPQAEWLERRIGAPALFAITGLRPEPKYTLPKLLWLREHAARDMARMRDWAGVPELVAHHLSGGLATNVSLACRTEAFDVTTRRWDAALLGLAGVDEGQMPVVLPAGSAAGGLTAAAAARIGLTGGIPVVVAGHDHLAGALGAGVTRPGEALDSMGSAEQVAVLTAAPVLDDELRRRGFSSGCHVVDGSWYVAGGLQASGALVEWFIDRILGQAPGGPDDARTDRYAPFLALLESAGPGPAETLVLPYLRGRTAPLPDPAAKLGFVGLTEAHGLETMAAALVDGAAFHVRWMLDELERLTGTNPSRISVIGAGGRNRRWIAAKAALGPGRLELSRAEEAAAFGAALTAGVAAGVYVSLAQAARDGTPSDRVRATASDRSRYEAAYRERWLPAVLWPAS